MYLHKRDIPSLVHTNLLKGGENETGDALCSRHLYYLPLRSGGGNDSRIHLRRYARGDAMGTLTDRKVFAVAKLMNITTEYLFQLSFRECRGYIFGLRSPEEVHDRWKRGLCSVPPYVVTFLDTKCATVH